MTSLVVSGSWESAQAIEWLSWRGIVGSMFWYVLFRQHTDKQTFFASAKIGAVLAVINPAYSEEELEFALRTVGNNDCRASLTVETKLFITTPKLNARSHVPLIKHLVPRLSLSQSSPVLPSLKHIVIIDNSGTIPSELAMFLPFHQLPKGQVDLSAIQKTLSQHDVVNLQFTSGTTGSPKAAMLTHQYSHLIAH
jgi:fatty-acyl-CoA synthase